MKRFVLRSGRAARCAARLAPFWRAHPLYRWTPRGFGYYRKLRRQADPAYVYERDKNPVRSKHFGAERLGEPDAEGIRALRHFERLRRLQAEPDWTWMLFQEPRRNG